MEKQIYSIGSTVLIFNALEEGFLASGRGSLFEELQGEKTSEERKKCLLTHENAVKVRQYFPFAAPSRNKDCKVSIGLGDRLGIAGAGQLKAIKGKKIFPVLAQQSIRELNLTGRSYEDVLDAATWAVMKSGYRGGFGADGDHLKKFKDIKYALNCGFSMITLDCSEHIHGEYLKAGEEKLAQISSESPEKFADYISKYEGKSITLQDTELTISRTDVIRFVLAYGEVIPFVEKAWKGYIKKSDIDFEISIDETDVSTEPLSHYMLAAEIIEKGVKISSMAPRFCGHFEKGVDYRGDLKQLEKEFKLHEAICEKLGYKISVHSGSDKFSAFPIIGKWAESFHLKTAGTSWLEAVRTIAEVNPALYRRMHAYAIKVNKKAKQFYEITSKTEDIPKIDFMRDEELPELLNREDVRQTLHIAYGYILRDMSKGKYVLREEVFDTLDKHIEIYYEKLEAHFNRHLALLGQ